MAFALLPASSLWTRHVILADARASAANIFEFLADAKWWVRTYLPDLNSAIEIGEAPIELLVTRVRSWVEAIEENRPTLFAGMEQSHALQVLQVFGFVVGSIERHLQGTGAKLGDGVGRVPGPDGLLLSLGAIARHSPRDSHYTFWLTNNEEPILTFTGNAGEVFFNKVVNETQLVLSDVSASVRDIRVAEENDLGRAAVIVRQAAQKVVGLHGRYREYMLRDPKTGERNMTPEFFMAKFRQYLLPFPVGGVLREGPNATNTTGWPLLDFLVGTLDEQYKDTVSQRFRWMSEIDQERVRVEMHMPSLAERILDLLEISPEMLQAMTQQQIRAAAFGSGSEFMALFDAYQALAGAALRLSDIHISLIMNYLVRPSKTIDPATIAKCPVKPVTGVGGNNLEHTFRIAEMRRKHPIVRCLAAA